MRMFLPIRGPGGRTLTPMEKAALIILGVTLVLCLVTLLAGEGAFGDDAAPNPVLAAVGALSRALGAGIVALYAIVLIWSALIYWKGEKVARVQPLSGRLFAAFCVVIGISGALGLTQLRTAGDLGTVVGGALGNTLGATAGFPILIGLMLLGLHAAGRGVWSAVREPMMHASGATLAPPPGYGTGTLPSPSKTPGGFGLSTDMPAGRRGSEPPMPDDGDPTPDERTFTVTRAVEEIERAQGVTIVDVEPEEEAPPLVDVRESIGEEVEQAPEPEPESEEGQVQLGLETVQRALADALETTTHEVETEIEEGQEEEPVGFKQALFDLPDPVTPPVVEEEPVAPDPDPEPEPEPDAPEEPVQSGGDPYAQGGLLRRVLGEDHGDDSAAAGDQDKPYSSFDWRGRPVE